MKCHQSHVLTFDTLICKHFIVVTLTFPFHSPQPTKKKKKKKKLWINRNLAKLPLSIWKMKNTKAIIKNLQTDVSRT